MYDCLLLKVAAAVFSVCPLGFSGLNHKGPAGCWQSLNLSADSTLHSRALFAWHWEEAPSPPVFLSPNSSKICSRNPKTPGTITKIDGEEMLLTSLLLKHQAGNMVQPEKPPVFEQAGLKMSAHSRVSISAESLTDMKDRVYFLGGNRGRGKTAAASLSITFRGKPDVSDNGWTVRCSLQHKVNLWKSGTKVRTVINTLKYAVY